MLKIRLQRVGRINSPAYRIVVSEHARAAKKGLLEKLGTYNPKTKERAINAERVKYWLSVGAQPSDTMHNMLVSLGIITGKKINILPKYKEPAKEEAPADSTPSTSSGQASSPQAEAAAPAAEAPAAEAPAEAAPEAAPADSKGSPQVEQA